MTEGMAWTELAVLALMAFGWLLFFMGNLDE